MPTQTIRITRSLRGIHDAVKGTREYGHGISGSARGPGTATIHPLPPLIQVSAMGRAVLSGAALLRVISLALKVRIVNRRCDIDPHVTGSLPSAS